MALIGVRIVDLAVLPVVSMDYGVRQLEDSNEVFQERQLYEWAKPLFGFVILSVTGLSVLLIWWKPITVLLS